jgi:hypothetical protein
MSATEVLRNLLTHKVADFPLARELRLVANTSIAEVVGCDRRTVESAIFLGQLDAVRAGGRTYAAVDAVVDWFERRQPRRCRKAQAAADELSGANAKPRAQRTSAAVPSKLRQKVSAR